MANNVTYSEFLEFHVQDVVSSNVKRLVKRSGKTTEYLSNVSNLSIPTINRLKAGQHLSIQSLCALAEALSVDPLDFFHMEEKK